MWIKQETALMAITGEEPPTFPTHLPTRMIVIDDIQKQMIRGVQIEFNINQPIQPQIAEILKNNPDIEFFEAIAFAVPIHTMADVCSLAQTNISTLVTNFTHIFTKEQLYSQTDWVDTLFIAPKVMHHTMRLWLCFHIKKQKQTHPPQPQLITTTPGKKTSRYTLNNRPNNITRKVARNCDY
jgi:hypothetical protein